MGAFYEGAVSQRFRIRFGKWLIGVHFLLCQDKKTKRRKATPLVFHVHATAFQTYLKRICKESGVKKIHNQFAVFKQTKATPYGMAFVFQSRYTLQFCQCVFASGKVYSNLVVALCIRRWNIWSIYYNIATQFTTAAILGAPLPGSGQEKIGLAGC